MFHAADGGHGSVPRCLWMAWKCCKGLGSVPRCLWRARGCSTLPVEGVGVLNAAGGGGGGVSHCGSVPHCP